MIDDFARARAAKALRIIADAGEGGVPLHLVTPYHAGNPEIHRLIQEGSIEIRPAAPLRGPGARLYVTRRGMIEAGRWEGL
jgi:hypothetical protein